MQRLPMQHRLHDITFRRDGRIMIGSRIARSIDLCAGDCVGILEQEGEFYLYSIKRPPGRCMGRCHSTKGMSRHLCANSVEISRGFLDRAGLKVFKVSFAAGEVVEEGGRKMIPIITRQPMLVYESRS